MSNSYLKEYNKRLENLFKSCFKNEASSEDIEKMRNIILIQNIKIKRQQKEIKSLKNKYSKDKIRNTIIKRFNEVIEEDYVSKVKLANKIEELEKSERQLQEESFTSDNYLFNKETIKRIVSQKDILKELLGVKE